MILESQTLFYFIFMSLSLIKEKVISNLYASPMINPEWSFAYRSRQNGVLNSETVWMTGNCAWTRTCNVTSCIRVTGSLLEESKSFLSVNVSHVERLVTCLIFRKCVINFQQANLMMDIPTQRNFCSAGLKNQVRNEDWQVKLSARQIILESIHLFMLSEQYIRSPNSNV